MPQQTWILQVLRFSFIRNFQILISPFPYLKLLILSYRIVPLMFEDRFIIILCSAVAQQCLKILVVVCSVILNAPLILVCALVKTCPRDALRWAALFLLYLSLNCNALLFELCIWLFVQLGKVCTTLRILQQLIGPIHVLVCLLFILFLA